MENNIPSYADVGIHGNLVKEKLDPHSEELNARPLHADATSVVGTTTLRLGLRSETVSQTPKLHLGGVPFESSLQRSTVG